MPCILRPRACSEDKLDSDAMEQRGMAEASQDKLRALQAQVEQKLGRCLLRFQAYETAVKGLLGHHKFTALLSHMDGDTPYTSDVSRKTLGSLVKQLLTDFLISESRA